MQALRCTHPPRVMNGLFLNSLCGRTRSFASTSAAREAARVPWFVDPNPVPQAFGQRQPPPHLLARPIAAPAVPEEAPDVLKILHAELLQSPHLETSELVVKPAVLPAPGPPLPITPPHGRRKRGGTYPGESNYDNGLGGIWSWVVMGQVKEGTENRGSIESVVRLVRKTLLKREPPLPLPPKSRRQNGSEWVMIDAGQFAIHILSKGARERYFNQTGWEL
ncbi:unnamed protein product [Cyclocybe aegerita]|uniref:Uncharacterized protein n=1 Tax=Cyclocybe aegerita TaxID=1973307 RepID=A0A8S0WDJ2_CYCAE|nr:unnamed protein product [Cyclocybe aegerita]